MFGRKAQAVELRNAAQVSAKRQLQKTQKPIKPIDVKNVNPHHN